MELYKKNCTMEMQEALLSLDRGMPLRRQVAHQKIVRGFLDGTRLGIRDFQAQKDSQDALLLAGQYDDVNACFLTLSAAPPCMAVTAVQPEHDFAGKELQNVRNEGPVRALDVISFSLVESTGKGIAVFSWIDGNPAADALVQSLLALPTKQQGSAVLRFAFEFTENLFLAPRWWETLDDSARSWVSRRFLSSIATERTASHLIDDDKTPLAISVVDSLVVP